MVRKRFAHFEQAGLCHIDEYFTKASAEPPDNSHSTGGAGSSLHSTWKAVLDKVNSNPTLEEQRLVVATTAYTVYDLMTEKVKDYKTALVSLPDDEGESTIFSAI